MPPMRAAPLWQRTVVRASDPMPDLRHDPHRLVLQIPPENIEVVAVIERAHAPSLRGLLRGTNAGVCPPVRFASPSLFCSDTLTVGY